MIAITYLVLWVRTRRLISVLTRFSVFVRRWVEPTHAFLPNGRSTDCRRSLITCGT